MCSRSATVRILEQHRSDAALIRKRMECVMESRLHRRPSGRFQLLSERRLEKSISDFFKSAKPIIEVSKHVFFTEFGIKFFIA
jgi:hypothetical protein